MTDLKAILDRRGSDYGLFCDQALISQDLKDVMRTAFVENQRYQQLKPIQRAAIDEGIEMILHKLARLANGDPTHGDSWDDIAGYATITIRDLRNIQKEETDGI